MSQYTLQQQSNGSGGETIVVYNNAIILQANQTSSAAVTFSVTNYNWNSMTVYFNIATLPGSASTTLALKVRGVDPVTGKFNTLLAAAARSATGMSVMNIGVPALSASAGGVWCYLPRDISILVSQSSGATSKDVTFSIGLHFQVT